MNEIKRIIETLLFVAHKPLTVETILAVTEFEKEVVEAALKELESDYQDRTLQVIKRALGYEMTSRPEYAPFIEKLLTRKIKVALSKPAMETLAIIAYKQPITRAEIDQIRGVNSDSPIDTLLNHELIREAGRKDALGKPFLYATTERFLSHFGLSDETELKELHLWKSKD